MQMMDSPARTRRAGWMGVALAAVLLLAACTGAGNGAATGDSSETDTGDEAAFACPEPNPRVEVTSEELNLFVWTEYIPQEMIDCFEEVYGITVNRDEFSSNEEMYAKISAGNTSYDLAQPTDQIVEFGEADTAKGHTRLA